MSAAVFLEQLRSRDIQLRLDGDQLRCNAPSGALTPDLRDQLQQRKDEILSFLRAATAHAGQQRAIVPLQPHGGRPPIFAVAGHNGDVFCFRSLVRHLGNDQPFFGLQPPGLDGQGEPLRSVEALAAYFAAQILAFRHAGPCVIAGYCAGGSVAFELARQLAQQGVAIRFVALFGSPHPAWYRFFPQLRQRWREQMARLRMHRRSLALLPHRQRIRYFADKLGMRKARREASRVAAQNEDPVMALRGKVETATIAALRRYTPRYFAGDLRVFLPSKAWQDPAQTPLRWPASAARSFVEYCGPDGCDGDIMLLDPHAAVTADLFRRCRDANGMA
jgi:thioesterase domain-containing protein